MSDTNDLVVAAPAAAAILDTWFSTLDDGVVLDRGADPFKGCFRRWYGKDPDTDAELRERFEPELLRVMALGARWDDALAAWEREPFGLVALTILLDQLPRNFYRGTPAMYAHDPLALAVATHASRSYDSDAALPLVYRMFLDVPLLHAENLTLQQLAVARFDQLAAAAAVRSPHNLDFFRFAAEYARRHRDVVHQFGRFPHRNAILGRQSTPDEATYLLRDDAGF